MTSTAPGQRKSREPLAVPAVPQVETSSTAAVDMSCLQSRGVDARRVCAWCRGPIPARARRDAVCCSKRCRQARHRFTRTLTASAGVAGGHGRHVTARPGGPRRLAYADPPYPGNAWLYRGHPDHAGEVDHAALIARLADYDAWALSTSAAALPAVLALCPAGVRVAAWHRGERPTRSRWPLSAWEPVIYHGGGTAHPSSADARRVDSLVHGVAPMTTLPGRVIGAKPAVFCRWLFALLAAAPIDTLDDLYPGSGAVSRAWAAFTSHPDPGTDASPHERPQASGVAGDVERDASNPPGLHDTSRRTSRDALPLGRPEASGVAGDVERDVSDPARADASPEVLHDASGTAVGDASSPAAVRRDASHPPAQTTVPTHTGGRS